MAATSSPVVVPRAASVWARSFPARSTKLPVSVIHRSDSGAHSATWPKEFRLRSRSDFRRVQGRGARITTRNFVVLWRSNRLKVARFGLTVSRKVGNAVTRNHIKRRLRESLRHRKGDLAGVDVVLIARRSAAGKGFACLDGQVLEALTVIGRLAK